MFNRAFAIRTAAGKRIRGYLPKYRNNFEIPLPPKHSEKISGDVMEIVSNVRRGVRKRKDLQRCGCGLCRAALAILDYKED